MLLVKYSDNWADEMDISGFNVLAEDQWNAHLAIAKKVFEENGSITYGVGTNEDVEFSSFKQYLSRFKVITITDEEAATLSKLFGVGKYPTYGYGFLPLEQIEMRAEDTDE